MRKILLGSFLSMWLAPFVMAEARTIESNETTSLVEFFDPFADIIIGYAVHTGDLRADIYSPKDDLFVQIKRDQAYFRELDDHLNETFSRFNPSFPATCSSRVHTGIRCTDELRVLTSRLLLKVDDKKTLRICGHGDPDPNCYRRAGFPVCGLAYYSSDLRALTDCQRAFQEQELEFLLPRYEGADLFRGSILRLRVEYFLFDPNNSNVNRPPEFKVDLDPLVIYDVSDFLLKMDALSKENLRQ